MRTPLARLLLVASTSALVAVSTHAVDDDEPEDAPLLPIPDLLRPSPRPTSATPPKVKGGCTLPPPPRSAAASPFLPGENLHYDVNVLGLRTGQVLLQANRMTRVDDTDVIPVSAYAKTDATFSVFGAVEGRMLTYLDADDVLPVRMVNHVQTKQMWKKPAISREDAAFSDDGQVASRVTYWKNGKARSWPGKSNGTTELVDVLSVVYYARTRTLVEGEPFCFQVYHRRRIWQVEGTVGPREEVSPPIGKRLARRVDVTAKRLGGKSSPESTRTITVHLSEDAARLPLAVRTKDGFTDIAVLLRGHLPGQRATHR